jgi:hypothetical protein
MKRLIAALTLGLTLGSGASLLWPQTALAVPASDCCRVCHKGKACGDSCIKAEYECRKAPGCACDEDDVDDVDPYDDVRE